MIAAYFSNAIHIPAPKGPVLFVSKHKALWEIIHHPKEKTVCIFDRELEPRLFGQREFLKEYELMLAHAGARLKVYTLPERLARFTDHQYDPFIDFVKKHPDATIEAVEKESGMPDSIWGEHQSYEGQGRREDNSGVLYPQTDIRHRDLGTRFVNLPRLYGCDGPSIQP